MTYLEALQNAIEQSAGCKASHLRSEPVKEAFEGKTVWEGIVEVFELKDHPKAKLAYGWGFNEGQETARFITILRIDPINNSQLAVKAYIASLSKNKTSKF